MTAQSGFIFAFCLDGQGGGKSVAWEDIAKWAPTDGTLWIHLDYRGEGARNWLEKESNIDPLLLESLTATETRPRSDVHKNVMLGILRGVNLNPGADPEDMVSIRFWIEEKRIVTMRHRRLMALEGLRKAVESGAGPVGSGDFLDCLADVLTARMGDVIVDIDDAFDAIEEEVLTQKSFELRPRLANIRRTVISLRRYIAPQRDVITQMQGAKVDWLNDSERMSLRETADRTTRFVEDLDAIRDRATVTQEELNSSLTEQMNKTMYVLSIVAGIFLPLGLLTGLLGINVGGIPGTENPRAFVIFCGLLIVIAAWQVWLFKRKKWM